MRKIIKKTLAGLIAGVMAVSSMPFAALTVQAADSTEKAYVKANIESFAAYTGTAKYTYNGTEASSYYSNVLYDDGAFNDGTSQSDSDNMHGKLYINDNVVLMYDGTNKTILPVVERAWTTSQFLAAAIYYSGSLVEDSTTSASWELSDNWIGGYQTYNEWPTGTGSYPSSSISYGSGVKLDTSDNYIFKNKLSYKGSSSDNYYEKFNNSIKLKIKAYYNSSKSKDIDVTNTTSNVYVVNYKPIADAISSIKSTYNTIQSTGEDKYCTDALENFYKAAYKVMTLNPNEYSYSTGVEKAVQDVANDIKNVVDNYLTTASTEPTKHSFKYAKNDADTHTVTCENCDYTTTEAHDFDENGICTKCEYDKSALDTSNYDTQLAIVKGIAENKDEKYTTDSITALKQIIDTVEAERENVTTQEELDALTKILMESTCDLAIAKNTVTFYTVAAGSTSPTEVDTQTLAYGTTYTANANANVKQWIVTTDKSNTSTKLNTFDSNVDVIVTKDVSIYAYLSDEDTSEASSKVTFLGKNNQVVAIRYVAAGEKFETSKVDVPEIPFYKGSDWDTASITGDGNEYTVKATYTYLLGAKTCQVNLVGEDGTVTWTKYYSYDSYVYLSTADKSQKYALYSDEACSKLLTYIDGVDFYAPKTEKVYVKAYIGESEPTVAVTGSFSTSTSTKNYANFNCKFYLPADATVVEWGLEVKVGDGQYAKVKAESKSERNEYTVKIGTKVDGGVTSIEGRAYLVYKYNGVTYTINSGDLTTVTFS